MHTRRDVLKTLGAGSLALAAPFALAARENPSKKPPNIVLILADDMGWSDLGCYGGEIATPHLDRLAEGGVRFTQFHNTAKCFPSRACLLTGLYAQQCGMDRKPAVLQNCVTLAEALRSAGYRTLMAGKHHGTENMHDRGFDRYFGLRDGCCNYFNPGLQREGEGKPAQKRSDRYWCIDDKTYSPYTPKEKDFYTTDYFTKYALRYLDEYQGEDKPFFLYLAYTAPHDPLMAWPEDIQKYSETYKVGYEAIRQARYARQKQMRLIDDRFPCSEATHPDWDSLTEQERKEEARKMAVYAAMIDRMDQNIGNVLKKIRDMGEEENTLVLFASDNGCSAEVVRSGYNVPGEGEIGSMTRWSSLGGDWANVSNTPYRLYKNYSHEGGICTPLIAYWPGGIQNAGRVSRRLGHFIDVMPTLLDAAAADYPTELRGEAVVPFEGESFLPELRGKDEKRQSPIFWKWSKGRAVRNNEWKLVSWNNGWELYDMQRDKTETRNVADKNPEVVKKMEVMYRDWLKKCGVQED
ncbi:MAG: arylsulfatase [Candidatus Omnitrophica bacterium]|nr:arylsulfatase [Candidatus Omnitrophota bacterium]